jgi:lipopolysaccharide transport system permease protein
MTPAGDKLRPSQSKEDIVIAVKRITGTPPSLWEFVNPVNMIRDMHKHRSLIRQFLWKEVIGRYKGTHLGLLWSLLNPLLSLAVYTLVFGVILKAKFDPASNLGTSEYALHLFCGIVLFNCFGVVASRAPLSIVDQPNLVKKVLFPLQILPVAILGGSLANAGFGLLILLGAMIILSGGISPSALLFPLTLIPLCALSLGTGWFLASLGVFIRDVGQAMGLVLQLLFFASPVIYPLSAAPAGFQWVLRLNPLTTILEEARHTLLLSQSLNWGWWFAVTAVSIFIMQFGYVWFMKSKRVFADLL